MVLVAAAAVASVRTGSSQSLPRLEPVDVTPALQELDFTVDRYPPFVVHPSGCLSMFDTNESQLVCIHPVSGATVRFGRAGSGPGEFGSAHAIAPSRSGGLLVFDGGRSRFTLIAPNWKLEKVVPSTALFVAIYPSDGDSVLALGGARGWDLVTVSLSSGATTTRFAPGAADTTILSGPFGINGGFWLVRRSPTEWYVVSPWHYRVLVEDNRGNLRSSFGRDVVPELPSEREVSAARRLMEKGNGPANLDGFMKRYAKTPKTTIAATPVRDPDGRLWLATGRIRQDSTEVDVFDAAGKFLGTRRIPGEVHAMTASGPELYVLVEYLAGPREGAQGVLRYRIRQAR